MDELKPEAVYFTEEDGMRAVLMVVDIASPADVPRLAEPFFLKFDAEVRMRIVMSPADLKSCRARCARQEMGLTLNVLGVVAGGHFLQGGAIDLAGRI